MNLDLQTCSRARLSRDPRFDGKFFIGVVTTGVYCRPICPVRAPKEENVRYFATAAAAAEAGFRPCLRCRPECSPGTPAWLGTPSTVSRALRLIDETGLEDGGIELLAERLGIGARHLRRLFLQHLGATPSAVAQTRRLHFAKKLIDETMLPMSEIALAAGFGSVRRFNAGIQKVYHRTPTHIRRLSRASASDTSNQYLFRLRYRPPLHWRGMLDFLRPRATPGVEAVSAATYCRSISLNGERGWFEVRCEPESHTLAVRLNFANPRLLFTIIQRIRAMFHLDADWSSIERGLSSDPALARRLSAMPGLRVPGCWDPFELSVRTILGQQVTVKGATSLAGRIANRYGSPFPLNNGLTHTFPTPEVLAEADLAGMGLTKARAATIRNLALAVRDRKLNFDPREDTETVLEHLCAIPGIGRWTAQYVAMRALGEPDAFPSGDLGLLRALRLRSTAELQARGEAWRPWRAYAAMYLWCVQEESSSDENRQTDYKNRELNQPQCTVANW